MKNSYWLSLAVSAKLSVTATWSYLSRNQRSLQIQADGVVVSLMVMATVKIWPVMKHRKIQSTEQMRPNFASLFMLQHECVTLHKNRTSKLPR